MQTYQIRVLGSVLRGCSTLLEIEAATPKEALKLANEAVDLGEIEPDQYSEEEVEWDEVHLEN